MGPGALSSVLAALRLPTSPNLLIGLEVSDDAAVYLLNAETALVQTVDFFPPIVDDAYTFGAIAAANALSDIYAMGAQPILALAVAAFPDDLDREIITAIMQGGADKIAEAGAALAGGHTVTDREPKYGLCVTGTAHPSRITPKANAQVGDRLLLTKPLGTGLITTAIKNDRGDPAHLEAAVASMLRLNKQAAELAAQVTIHSATDITGFGLLGHAAEIARNSNVGMRFRASGLPALPGAREYAAAGIFPGGLERNLSYLEEDGYVRYEGDISAADRLLLYDPQTSGGLFFAAPPDAATALQRIFAAAGAEIWEIGEVTAEPGIMVTG